MTVDDSQLERFKRMTLINRGPSDTGGDPPDPPGDGILAFRVEAPEKRIGDLDRKLDRNEVRFDGVDARLRTVETGITRIEGRADAIEKQLALIVSQMPRWWQPTASAAALVVLIMALLGLARAIHLIG